MIKRFYSSDNADLNGIKQMYVRHKDQTNESYNYRVKHAKLRQEVYHKYGEIEYDINEHYFRTDTVKEPRDVLIIGCSITAGVGIHEHQMYANNWCRENNYSFYNLAFPGAGFETMYRILDEYIDIARPNIVLCCYPYSDERREIRYPHKDQLIHPYHFQNVIPGDDRSLENNNQAIMRELFHVPEIQIMRKRTLDAIRWLCYSRDFCSEIIEFDGAQTIANDKGARDACHPSDVVNEKYLTKLRNETRNIN